MKTESKRTNSIPANIVFDDNGVRLEPRKIKKTFRTAKMAWDVTISIYVPYDLPGLWDVCVSHLTHIRHVLVYMSKSLTDRSAMREFPVDPMIDGHVDGFGTYYSFNLILPPINETILHSVLASYESYHKVVTEWTFDFEMEKFNLENEND